MVIQEETILLYSLIDSSWGPSLLILDLLRLGIDAFAYSHGIGRKILTQFDFETPISTS